MGTSDDDWRARRKAWVLFLFDQIWVFVLRAPSSSDVPVLLLNQLINTEGEPTEAEDVSHIL